MAFHAKQFCHTLLGKPKGFVVKNDLNFYIAGGGVVKNDVGVLWDGYFL